MADQARARRLAKRIMTIVAAELQAEVKDPRLGMVTVTAATVTPDLRDATVYYTVLGDAQDRADSTAALASATGVLRTAVGRQTGIKFTPTLAFELDTVAEHSRHIEALLDRARESDAAVAARAVGARFAGEEDPYRQPRSAVEDAEEGAADAADDAAFDAAADDREDAAGDG